MQVQGIVEKFEVESGRFLSEKGNLRAHIDSLLGSLLEIYRRA